ncbi:MAG: signal peptidase I [Bacilli bacterium]
MYSFINKKIMHIAIIIVLILAIIFSVKYQIYYIIGSSMEPTIHKNSFIIVKENQQPKYGDIIVIDFGDNMEKEAKRIVGIPGDKIILSDYVYVNGVKYINSRCDVDTCVEQEYQLNIDEYFVVGDNYLRSIDSRIFGAIKSKQILGVHN